MDASRFDHLSRLFGRRHRRRTTLAGFGALLAGLLNGPADQGEAAPRRRTCRAPGKRCGPGQGTACCQGATCQRGRCRCASNHRSCGRRCLPKHKCCRHKECPENQRCMNGRCRCRAGRKRCQNRCIRNRLCCGGCPPWQKCVEGECLRIPRRVFVTSETFSGNLNGIEGADQQCQSLAESAGLTGTFKAWLSTRIPESSPSVRFTNTATAGPFLLVDDTVIATSWEDLTSGTLRAPINQTELGVTITSELVWTNTLPDGTSARDSDCGGWHETITIGVAGRSSETDAEWTYGPLGIALCPAPGHRLYCFEQG